MMVLPGIFPAFFYYAGIKEQAGVEIWFSVALATVVWMGGW